MFEYIFRMKIYNLEKYALKIDKYACLREMRI